MTVTTPIQARHDNTDSPERPRVVGIDTSLTATGIASSLGWCRLVGYSDWCQLAGINPKKQTITKLPHSQRIQALSWLAKEIAFEVGAPDMAVIETPAYAQSGGGAHERGFLWWAIYQHLANRDVPIALMTPQQRMLYATGKGSGGKGGVIDAVARRWPAFETSGNDNLADAVTLAAAGIDALGHPLGAMPAVNRAALDKVEWPQIGGTP